MNDLIKLVSDKSGISESQAKSAIETIVSTIKDKMPNGIGEQVASFLESGKSPLEEIGGLKDKVSGFFGK
ncbi:MAG: hypothetical protein KJ941_01240 [Bacteroidetes bacterium]|nr:hypothetical protein [Bacteroidota bacterium]